jgi:hypothetical protein
MVDMSESEHETQPDQPESGDNGTGENGRQNLRSTIAFPYGALQDAEQVVEALRQRGDTAPVDALAAEMNQTTTSGSFRTKVATARIFGVIEVRSGHARLTPLGHRLVDSDQAAQARVDAFLHVPLFQRVYDEYRGRNLPPSQGLEAAIARFGVSAKQVNRARQALQRSAEHAGFFKHGRDRLVAPAPSGGPDENDGVDESNRTATPSSLPAWAEQMWLTLLSEEAASWTPEQTKAYVDGARTAFKAQG